MPRGKHARIGKGLTAIAVPVQSLQCMIRTKRTARSKISQRNCGLRNPHSSTNKPHCNLINRCTVFIINFKKIKRCKTPNNVGR